METKETKALETQVMTLVEQLNSVSVEKQNEVCQAMSKETEKEHLLFRCNMDEYVLKQLPLALLSDYEGEALYQAFSEKVIRYIALYVRLNEKHDVNILGADKLLEKGEKKYKEDLANHLVGQRFFQVPVAMPLLLMGYLTQRAKEDKSSVDAILNIVLGEAIAGSNLAFNF